MIQRKRYTKEYKEKLVLEMLSGQFSSSQISRREGISVTTLSNWRRQLATTGFTDENRKNIELRQRVAELESAVGELALENLMLKKPKSFCKSTSEARDHQALSCEGVRSCEELQGDGNRRFYYSRHLVGCAISTRNSREIGKAALEKAQRTCGSLKGCIHHTDSDVRYCSREYIRL